MFINLKYVATLLRRLAKPVKDRANARSDLANSQRYSNRTFQVL